MVRQTYRQICLRIAFVINRSVVDLPCSDMTTAASVGTEDKHAVERKLLRYTVWECTNRDQQSQTALAHVLKSSIIRYRWE